MSKTWYNWSKLLTANPNRVVAPWTQAALHRDVGDAIASSRRIKAVGSGHSFTGIAVAEDIQLDLSNYTGVVELDLDRQRITLRSGTKLWQIPPLLADSGLAMQNLGDINRQSIVGAIATSTHGTGAAYGGLASQVVGLEMITGTGETLQVSATQNSELLDALRVNLGAFGIVTQVTLQLVPEFELHTMEQPETLAWVIANWHELHARHDHFELFWFGHDTKVMTKSSQRLPVRDPATRQRPSLRQQLVDELVANAGLSVVCRIGKLQPALVPWLNRLSTKVWGSSQRTAHWSTAFNSPRRVRFNEMEYALPFDDIPEILKELRQQFQRHELASTFPLEVRAAAPETGWLATNHQRKTGYIAVHQHAGQDHRDYFSRVEPIFKAAAGRPHWGKLHTLDVTDFAELYPNWSQTLTLRDRLDPHRHFTNAYLDQIMGG